MSRIALRENGKRPYRALGLRIRKLRMSKGLTQAELARAIGKARGYPGTIESGFARPDARVLMQIADELGCDYAELARMAGYGPRPVPDDEAEALMRDIEAGLDEFALKVRRTLRLIRIGRPPAVEQAS